MTDLTGSMFKILRLICHYNPLQGLIGLFLRTPSSSYNRFLDMFSYPVELIRVSQ